MLKNYIKIAWKVLLRRKFFTFVSLFGIVFTLLVLMVVAAFADNFFFPAEAGSRFDRTLEVNRIELQGEKMHIYSSPSYYFLNKYVRPMRTPELVSLHSSASEVVSYIGGSKLALQIKHTDAEFWEIMEFDFMEGAAFDREAVRNADNVAVISDKAARQAFGDELAAGQFIETSEGSFRVLGVIDHKQVPTQPAYADIYVPVTLDNYALTGTDLFSRYNAYVLASDEIGTGAVKQEFEEVIARVLEEESGSTTKLITPYQYNRIECVIGTQLDQAVAHFTRNDSPGAAVLTLAGIFLLMILFMLFPALNLVNINISRIIERSSEVGVRRAFGASRRALVGQFLVENIVLTFIGGAMAFILSCIVLYIINDSGLIPYGQLDVNYHILIYAVILCLVFGFVSGVLPAYRMSRLHPVEALRGIEL